MPDTLSFPLAGRTVTRTQAEALLRAVGLSKTPHSRLGGVLRAAKSASGGAASGSDRPGCLDTNQPWCAGEGLGLPSPVTPSDLSFFAGSPRTITNGQVEAATAGSCAPQGDGSGIDGAPVDYRAALIDGADGGSR